MSRCISNESILFPIISISFDLKFLNKCDKLKLRPSLSKPHFLPPHGLQASQKKKEVSRPSLLVQRDKRLKNKTTLQRDDFKIRPTVDRLVCPISRNKKY
jgi:hypothetical protein